MASTLYISSISRAAIASNIVSLVGVLRRHMERGFISTMPSVSSLLSASLTGIILIFSSSARRLVLIVSPYFSFPLLIELHR